jgi:hypothetical protein
VLVELQKEQLAQKSQTFMNIIYMDLKAREEKILHVHEKR